jgi:hypothetical protein
MSYKKHFKVNTSGALSPISGAGGSANYSPDVGYRNWGSNLPDVYTGHPNRIERYNQYESMDQDPEINGALDTIAEFATQDAVDTEIAFTVKYHDKATDTESEIITKQLKQWYNLQDFDKRVTKLFRNVCKYGDQVFIRDPETFQLFWTDMHKVTKVVVNESEGKKPEKYFVKDLGPNFGNLTSTTSTAPDTFLRSPQQGGVSSSYTLPNQPYTGGSRFTTDAGEVAVDAQHIVHFSLTEGLDPNWPFGVSILETVFKTFKQKELLEDAILIYRVQRAPERRVFYIDVGNMPSHIAMQFVERVKNEIHQRRIPTQTGGGTSIMDSTYNPLSINEDYFFPQTAEGRGSKVETLPGGENLGQIDDLKYFNNKLLRGLRVPSSYLPSGPEDGTQSYTDGRVTTALIQEFRFNQYLKRIQKLVAATVDREFKTFLSWRGFNIDNSIFEVRLTEPMNFAGYREIELDSSRINSFTAIAGTEYMSKRFLLKKYLGLSDIEIKENEMMWFEEQGETGVDADTTGSDLRNVGISSGDIGGDIDNIEGIEADVEGEAGVEAGAEVGAAPGAVAGAVAAPTPGAATGGGLPGTV